LLQYVSGKATATFADEVVPDFPEVLFRLGRYQIARHLACIFWCVELREQFRNHAIAIEPLTLPKRFQALGDLRVHFVSAKPAPLRQVPLHGLGDELTRVAVLFLRGCLHGGEQIGWNECILPGVRAHALTLSTAARAVKGRPRCCPMPAAAE